MGRYRKIKTELEQDNYRERRREQNRINQYNFRERKKIIKKIIDTPSYIKNDVYKNSLKTLIKKVGFNYFITLTTRRILTPKYLNILTNRLIDKLKNVVDVERVFYVIEKNERPHIHILLKTSTDYKTLKNSVNLLWEEGFVYPVKVYSQIDDYTLENYVIKEVYYNSSEVNWWIL